MLRSVFFYITKSIHCYSNYRFHNNESNLLLFVVLLTVSCTNAVCESAFDNCPILPFADSLHPIEVKIPDKADDFYSCVDSVSLIFLETTDDNLIGEVCSVVFFDTVIVVSDWHVAQAIYVFDRSGNYLHSVGGIGRAEGEYNSFCLSDVQDENILIVDNLSSRLLCYRVSGDFKYERDLNYHYPSSLCRLPSGSEIHGEYVNQPYMVSIRDSVGKARYCALRNHYPKVERLPELTRSDDGSALLHYDQCDTIFSVSDSLIYAKYVVDLHKYDTDAYLRELSNMSESEQIRAHNSLDSDKCSLASVNESESYLSCVCGIGSQCYLLLFNRISGLVFLFNTIMYNIDTGSFSSLLLPGALHCHFSNSLLFVIDYSSFSMMDEKSRESFLSKIDSRDKEAFLERIKDSGENPVLCMFYLNI